LTGFLCLQFGFVFLAKGNWTCKRLLILTERVNFTNILQAAFCAKEFSAAFL